MNFEHFSRTRANSIMFVMWAFLEFLDYFTHIIEMLPPLVRAAERLARPGRKFCIAS